MAHHEKEQPHEVFVGNTRRDDGTVSFLAAKGMRTARLGKVAYCIEGKPLSNDYAPIFIDRKEAELHNSIMMERTFGPNWRRG